MAIDYNNYKKEINTVQKLTSAVSISRGGKWDQYFYGRGINSSTVVVYSDKEGRKKVLTINNVADNVIDEIRYSGRWIG